MVLYIDTCYAVPAGSRIPFWPPVGLAAQQHCHLWVCMKRFFFVRQVLSSGQRLKAYRLVLQRARLSSVGVVRLWFSRGWLARVLRVASWGSARRVESRGDGNFMRNLNIGIFVLRLVSFVIFSAAWLPVWMLLRTTLQCCLLVVIGSTRLHNFNSPLHHINTWMIHRHIWQSILLIRMSMLTNLALVQYF